MEELKQIISSLLTSEKKWLIHAFNFNADERKDNKKFRLLKLVLQRKPVNDQKACKILYDSEPNSAFSHLKKRLKEDILHFVVFSPHLKNSANTPNSLDVHFEEQLIKIRWALEKELYNEALNKMQSLWKEAKKHNKPFIQLTIKELFHKYNLNINLQKNSSFDEVNLIEKHYFNISSTKPTNNHNTAFSDQDSAAYDEFLYQNIDEINNLIFQKQFRLALTKALEVLDKTNLTKSELYNKNLKYELEITIAKTYLYLNKTQPAELIASNYNQNYPCSIKLRYIELQFLCCLKQKNINGMQSVLATFKIDETDKKWCLYEATFHFISGEHKKSLRTLHKCKGLWGDRSGIVLGYKLLELMNLIHLKEYDWFELKVDAFRKIVSRFNLAKYNRISIICYLLKRMIATNYNYKKLVHTENKQIELLRKAEENNFYDPFGPEIIRLDEWLDDLSNGIIQKKMTLKSDIKNKTLQY